MTKQRMVRDAVQVSAYQFYGNSIEEFVERIVERLKNVVPEGATEVRYGIEHEHDYDGGICGYIEVSFQRPENAKEQKQREGHEADRAKWEQRQYEYLKKKFENK